MSGRIYYAPFEDVELTNADDRLFWELGAVTHRTILHGFSVYPNNDFTGVTEVSLKRATTTGTGSAVTEVSAQSDDGVNTAVVKVGGTHGTAEFYGFMAWEWRHMAPLEMIFLPHFRILTDPGEFLVLNAEQDGDGDDSRASSVYWSGWLCWEEV